MLIYAGDYDFVCNWVGNMRWTLDLEWKGSEEFRNAELRGWFLDADAEKESEAAGLVRSSGNFSFATVHGAGHLVSL